MKLARAFHEQERQSLLARARYASLAGTLSVASPMLAASDPAGVANGIGDDPTQPLGKIEILDRYTGSPHDLTKIVRQPGLVVSKALRRVVGGRLDLEGSH